MDEQTREHLRNWLENYYGEEIERAETLVATYLAEFPEEIDEGWGVILRRAEQTYTCVRDEDCDLDENDICKNCGVFHSTPCSNCGGRGFHRKECPNF